MKSRRIILATGFVVLVSGCGALWAAQGELLKAVLVVVGESRITRSDLNEMAQFLLRRRYGNIDLATIRMDAKEMDELSAAAMRELIIMHLILDEAEKMELSVTDEEVMEAVNQLQIDPDKLPAIGRRRTEANLLESEILKSLGVTGSLPTPAEMREVYRKQKDTVFTTASQIKLRHILLPTTNLSGEDTAISRARSIKKTVMDAPPEKRTELFAEKARLMSDDAFASGGGVLRISPDPEGWFRQDWGNRTAAGKEAFPSALYRSMQGLGPEHKRVVVGPIRTEQGVHLLYLEDIRVGKTMSWRDAQPLIRRYVQKRRKFEQTQKWLRDKIRRTKITWHDGSAYPTEEILTPKKQADDESE